MTHTIKNEVVRPAADPDKDGVGRILERLDEIEEKINELLEKVNEIGSDYGIGFSIDS